MVGNEYLVKFYLFRITLIITYIILYIGHQMHHQYDQYMIIKIIIIQQHVRQLMLLISLVYANLRIYIYIYLAVYLFRMHQFNQWQMI